MAALALDLYLATCEGLLITVIIQPQSVLPSLWLNTKKQRPAASLETFLRLMPQIVIKTKLILVEVGFNTCPPSANP